ncbi:MAG: hypothetical protein HYX73_06315 [Acidobacteria bacterium]|nr:hypothetical protein [Acidobacteriota bacterium]
MGIVQSRLSLALAWAALSATLAAGASFACAQGELPAGQEDPARAIARLVREMQMDLEGSSSTGVLGKIDRAKFEDYPRFRDMVERLTREDTLRVFFRQVSYSLKEGTAQTLLDAEMEMTRKDSAVPAERRRQQITIDLELTSRGWKIVNITPREFFRPL